MKWKRFCLRSTGGLLASSSFWVEQCKKVLVCIRVCRFLAIQPSGIASVYGPNSPGGAPGKPPVPCPATAH